MGELDSALDAPGRRRPARPARPGAARAHRGTGAGAEPDRRRTGPHRPPRRARSGPGARRAEVDGLLAARALPPRRPGPASPAVRAGRTVEQLPAVAAGFAAGLITADQVAVIAPVVHPAEPGHGRRAGHRPGRGRPGAHRRRHHRPARPAPPGRAALPRPARPRRPRTRPHRGPVADHHPARRRRRSPAGSTSTPSAGRRCRPCWSPSCRRTGPPGTTAPAPSSSATRWSSGPTSPSPPAAPPVLRTVKPHVFVTIGIEDLIDPATGPRRRHHGLRRADLRRPGPLAGLRRRDQPDHHGPRRPGRWTTAAATGSPHRRCAEPSNCPTRAASSPAAGHPPTGATSIMFSSGTPTSGETSLENSALLCERHHTKVHHGFRVERDPDGRWHTYRPDGTEILIPVPLRT